MTDNPTVLPCDREAMESILWVETLIDDREAIALAFARHRTAAEKGAGGEAIAWMARHKVTKGIYWDDECCVCCAKSGADEIASYLEDHESFPLYAHPPQPNAALVEALREVREALHFHYTEWDGEPEDAVPLQLARDRIDAILAGKG